MIPTEPDFIEASQLTIPPESLSDEILQQLAKEFLLREQAQENWNDDIESSVEKVIALIRKGDVQITFDALTESVGVKARDAFKL